MASTFYKYAERDADSQVNWAEVGKGLSDMLSETNRVRQEKKDALDAAQRETMKYLAETPNGEHVGARQSILEYSNMASNQLRIMKQLMEQGQLDVKDYTIFRQNLTDNTNLAFNANKAYQENYADVMNGVRDKTYSQLTADNYAEAELFGNWKNIGWQIAPNGVVMAGKMIEQEVDGKKVRTLDKTPEGLRSMDYLNQAILSKIPFYKYEDKVDSWVDTLGKNIEASTLLGKIGAQGLSRSLEDVTKKKYAKEGDMQAEYTFIQSENDFIDTVVGLPVDAARVLVDSAIFAPNNKQYRITTSEKDAKDNPEAILKVVDTDSGGVKYVISKEQQKQANEFIRTQMRAKYDKIEKEDVVGQVSRDEESDEARKAKKEDKEAEDAASMLGKLYYGSNTEVGSAIDYFKGITNKDGEVLFKKITRDKTGVTILLKDGSTEKISFTDANGKPRTQEDFIRSAGPLLAGQKDINKALEKGSYKKGAKFNEASRGEAATQEKFKMNPDVLARPSQEAYQNIQTSLPKGFKVIDKGGYTGNEIQIIAPDGTRYNTKSKQTGDKALTAIIGIEDFVNAYIQKQDESGSAATATTTVKGGRTR
jgi:hypothetical protein